MERGHGIDDRRREAHLLRASRSIVGEAESIAEWTDLVGGEEDFDVAGVSSFCGADAKKKRPPRDERGGHSESSHFYFVFETGFARCALRR
jgi:hypothetical protein